MAATLLFMLPVIVALLRRPAGLRRGRHPDRGEGMSALKLAVVGGGSTYTPELVSGLARESGARRDRRAVAAGHRRASAARSSAALAARMLDRARASEAGSRSPTSSTGRCEGADAVLIQIRVGGQAARFADETVPLALRLHRPGDHRRRRVREGDAHRAGRARDRRPGSRAGRRPTHGSSISPIRSGSSLGRCSMPIIGRLGSATSRSASSARSRRCSESSRSRIAVDQVGLNHLTWVRAVLLDGAGRARRAARRAR